MTASNGRNIGRVVALVIPVGVFLSLAACTIDNGPTGLLIEQDQWLDTGTSTNAGTCSVPAAATSTERGEGVLDVAVLDEYHTHYLFYPLVENQLASLAGLASGSGTTSPADEKNNIVMDSFHVELNVATSDGSSFLWDPGCSGEFDVPTGTATLAPGGTLSTSVEIIRPCNAAPLFRYLQGLSNNHEPYPAIEVTTNIRAVGYLGSSRIKSPPFDFKVTACYGCLQHGYSDSAAAQFAFPFIPQCSDLAANPYNGDPCNPAQDDLVLCCATSWDAEGHAQGMECPGIPTASAH